MFSWMVWWRHKLRLNLGLWKKHPTSTEWSFLYHWQCFRADVRGKINAIPSSIPRKAMMAFIQGVQKQSHKIVASPEGQSSSSSQCISLVNHGLVYSFSAILYSAHPLFHICSPTSGSLNGHFLLCGRICIINDLSAGLLAKRFPTGRLGNYLWIKHFSWLKLYVRDLMNFQNILGVVKFPFLLSISFVDLIFIFFFSYFT